ncbi:MAG TPA: family 20 glycosylhydrolase [Steroidobacteraceae bacterium]|jgi:hexosaminidase|nr:family 20 glycosylhydrolase [Steroidobacteraceae bacterium]
MNGAIGHWGRQTEAVRALSSAGAAEHVPVRVASMLRRAGAVSVGFPMVALWLATTGMATATPAAPALRFLLPAPTHIRLASSGIVAIVDGARVAVRGADRAQVQPIVDRFIELLATTRGLQLQAASVADPHPAIIFEVDPRTSVAADGGYRIVSGARGVRVIARSTAGLFYGSVTLWQLLTPPGWISGTAAEIAAGVIDDQPRFAWRALLLDSGRHLQRVTDIEKLIDWMSLEKLNVLVWHLTEDQGWRLEIPKYPALTKVGACRQAAGLDSELTGAAEIPYCGFYTEAEVRDIVRYAAARFVSVVPEIDLPGHSQAAVAAYPWLGVTGERPPVWTDWGISPWLLKPDERTLQFVDDVLDEAMQLFPSRYLSIGGDEADKQQWNASPELRARMQRLALTNMDQLQGWFTGQVAEHLLRHGRMPVGWDDELVAGEKLPASQVVMSWHGSDQEQVALEALAQGHEVVLTPEESLYFDHYQSGLPDESPGQPPMTTLRQAYDTVVIPNGATAAEAQRVIGVQGNLWTELIPDFGLAQHALFPRMAALSELGWSRADTRDWNGFLERLTAELGRYRALGVAYADTAFAPAFDVTTVQEGKLRVALSNQVSYGEIRYTTDASVPTSTSARYVGPLEFAAEGEVTLRAATFAPSGFELAAPRARVLDASTLLTHDSGELPSCSNQPPMRLGGRQPAQGPRPVYAADVGDMCWLWRRAPLRGIGHVTLTVERVAWRFGDEAQGAVVRPKAGAAGEFEIHADSCAGPLLARLPLTPVGQGDGQRTLSAEVSPSAPTDPRDLCIFATGDPREGQWALARTEFSK